MATDREKLEQQAKLHQMYINTRLVALETAMKLMHHHEYSQGNPANKVDCITLIAQAQNIEEYILGTIDAETKQIIEELNKPKPSIVKATEVPKSGLRL